MCSSVTVWTEYEYPNVDSDETSEGEVQLGARPPLPSSGPYLGERRELAGSDSFNVTQELQVVCSIDAVAATDA